MYIDNMMNIEDNNFNMTAILPLSGSLCGVFELF